MKKQLTLLFSLLCIYISAQTTILDHKYYTTLYDTVKGRPVYSTHFIVWKKFNDTIDVERSSNFKRDSLVKSSKQYSDADFAKGYDKGHLSPVADLKWSQPAEKSTMVYTNCAPQVAQFNRGLWKSIETYVRSLMYSYDTIYVWTGVIYDKSKPKSKVPTHFWKAIQLKLDGVTMNTLGFMCENKQYSPKSFPQDHTCTVKHIEATIGQTLFTIGKTPGYNSNTESILKNNEKMIIPINLKK